MTNIKCKEVMEILENERFSKLELAIKYEEYMKNTLNPILRIKYKEMSELFWNQARDIDKLKLRIKQKLES